jgi:signal transduction histidine kinase
MRLSTRTANILFTATAVFILLISYILFEQVSSLINSQEQLNETNIIKLKLEQTLSALKDGEIAQRGFLLTKDSVFLQPYYGGYERSKILLKDINDLTRGNAYQQKDLDNLTTNVLVRFKTFNQVISQYNTPNISAHTREQHLLRGKSVMDSIDHYVQKIKQREESLVFQKERSKRKYLLLTPLFAILLIGTSIGILIFSYRKITEQLARLHKIFYRMKNLNSELKQKNYKLQLYNKELDSFSFIASHDLKEPIRKILTYTNLIETSWHDSLTEFNKNNFRRIKLSAIRMQNLLNDLLLYSHIDTAPAMFEEVDMNKLLRDVVDDLQEEISESGAKIITNDLPKIKALPFQVKQLLENLLINSIKYKRDDLPPAISINSSLVHKHEVKEKFPKESRSYYKLEYADNGLGFEQVYAEKVFNLFERLLQNTNSQTGTGIGLTICKKIVENHNGYITVYSDVKKGTTFYIYLPAND